MRYFCAESNDGEVVYDHTFRAADQAAAVTLCERNGWTFLGELVESVDIPDVDLAILERNLTGATLH